MEKLIIRLQSFFDKMNKKQGILLKNSQKNENFIIGKVIIRKTFSRQE